MSLSNDILYPQYLVVGFFLNDKGDVVDSPVCGTFSTRSSALSFIRRQRCLMVSFLRSDAFDSYIDSLTPAFRLYHLTRAKI